MYAWLSNANFIIYAYVWKSKSRGKYNYYITPAFFIEILSIHLTFHQILQLLLIFLIFVHCFEKIVSDIFSGNTNIGSIKNKPSVNILESNPPIYIMKIG